MRRIHKDFGFLQCVLCDFLATHCFTFRTFGTLNKCITFMIFITVSFFIALEMFKVFANFCMSINFRLRQISVYVITDQVGFIVKSSIFFYR